MKLSIRLIIAISFVFHIAEAQTSSSSKVTDTIKNFSTYKRAIKIGGLLQTRYLASLTDQVDINGKNFDPAATAGKITNSFALKRVRLSVKGTINDHFSANVLVNFADFNSNPANKVLENAYIKYTSNKYFNIQAGQFRPFFGIEDAISNDIIRTLDYSNQYYAFGSSGWQSFQSGVSVFGDLSSTGKFRYYAGAYNGNNRNQPTDNDNTKNVYARIEGDVANDITIGVNAASGSSGNGTGNALGVDVKANVNLNKRWQFSLMGEYKNGTNFTLYNALTVKPFLHDVRMQGFYIFPIIHYNFERPRLRGIEFSSRYEYMNENYKLGNNTRQTIIPNMTLIFADDFYAALQMGVSIELFKHDVPLTTTYSHNLAYLQLQVRF